MGKVLRALDLPLRRRVAVKFLADEAPDEDVVARFRDEAAALAAVRSEHVARVHAFGGESGRPYFVMEFVDGKDLGSIIDEHAEHRATVPVSRASSILRHIARGLAAVHAAGLAHRDIKPSNVVIERGSGRPVLVDFGLAVAVHQKLPGASMGSPAYMAPEQQESWKLQHGLGVRADLYALAVTAFELLTGRLPFAADDVRALLAHHQHVVAPKISSFVPALAPADPVFERALAKQPLERQESVGAFSAALERALDQVRSVATPEVSSGDTPVDAANAPAVRVLICDDDPIFGRLLTRAVQLAFFGTSVRVAAVTSGADAVARATGASPQLILLDFEMPGLDGAETLSRLRDLPNGGDGRVVVISGGVNDSARWRLSVLGVTEFVSKPIDLPGLVELVGRVAREQGWLVQRPADTPTAARR